jgi:hypothetical protein
MAAGHKEIKMEIVLGFSIAAFLAVVSLDTLQQRRHNLKQNGMQTRDRR